MIQELQVQNFYSIREKQTFSFLPTNDDKNREKYVHEVADGVQLLKIGIVYGSNASGKTTLLKAFSFLHDIMINQPLSKNDVFQFSPFLLDKHSRHEHSFMQLTVWLKGEKYLLGLEFDTKRIYEESLFVYTSNRPTMLYKRVYLPNSDHTKVTFGNKSGIGKSAAQAIEGNTTNNCSVMAAFGKSNVPTTRLNDVYDFFCVGMQVIMNPRDYLSFNVKDELWHDNDGMKKRFLLELLKACDYTIVDMTINKDENPVFHEIRKRILEMPISEDEQKEILKNSPEPHDIIFHHMGEDGEYELDERFESAGTRRFLAMSILLYYLSDKSHFIPIDEVETSIHYELLYYFIRFFLASSEGTSQLLLSTHDINLLNEKFIRRDVVWFTDKNKLGVTQLKRLSSLGLHKSMNPYNAYKQGKLLNLPFLENI